MREAISDHQKSSEVIIPSGARPDRSAAPDERGNQRQSEVIRGHHDQIGAQHLIVERASWRALACKAVHQWQAARRDRIEIVSRSYRDRSAAHLVFEGGSEGAIVRLERLLDLPTGSMQRALRGHSEVTQRGHSERALRGHSEGTQRALRGHSERALRGTLKALRCPLQLSTDARGHLDGRGNQGQSIATKGDRTWPRMPETVLMDAPSNLATSREELNMPPTKAVCLRICEGKKGWRGWAV